MHFINIVFIISIGISVVKGAATINATNVNTRQTTGGTQVADITEARYQASVQLAATNKHLCSASLIDDQNLLTSAYCVHELISNKYELREADTLQVVLGTTKIGDTNNENLVKLPLKYIFIHEDWSDTERVHDIAVIRVDEAIEDFTDYVKNTNIATTSPKEGDQCTSYGWSSDSTASKNRDLMKVTFNLKKSECGTAQTGTVGEDEFCGDGEECKGEWGSPVICGDLQAGIVSIKTCESNDGPMTDVAYYKEWIETQQKRSGSSNLLNSIYLIGFCMYTCLFAYRSL